MIRRRALISIGGFFASCLLLAACVDGGGTGGTMLFMTTTRVETFPVGNTYPVNIGNFDSAPVTVYLTVEVVFTPEPVSLVYNMQADKVHRRLRGLLPPSISTYRDMGDHETAFLGDEQSETLSWGGTFTIGAYQFDWVPVSCTGEYGSPCQVDVATGGVYPFTVIKGNASSQDGA